MYTFNNFIYGHDLSVDKELNNLVHGLDLDFSMTINDRLYEISTPYHGGQCLGDTFSVIIGTIITDDDDNKEYIFTVRNSKEEEYTTDYSIFLKTFVDSLLAESYDEPEYKESVNALIPFLLNTAPGFYSVEASS